MHNLLLNKRNHLHILNFRPENRDYPAFSGRRCGTRMCYLEPKGSSKAKEHQKNRTFAVKCFLTDTGKGQDGLFQGQLISTSTLSDAGGY